MSTTDNPFEIHSKRCQAAAIIAAVENIRDQEVWPLSGPDRARPITLEEFRATIAGTEGSVAGDGVTLLDIADGYLADGIMTCVCHVAPIAHVLETLAPHDGDDAEDAAYRRRSAQELAEHYLASRRITPTDYLYLVKRSEGRGI